MSLVGHDAKLEQVALDPTEGGAPIGCAVHENEQFSVLGPCLVCGGLVHRGLGVTVVAGGGLMSSGAVHHPPPVCDPAAIGDEVRRLAGKGCRAISRPELPHIIVSYPAGCLVFGGLQRRQDG